jgi:SAM-dependent methyltransferase
VLEHPGSGEGAAHSFAPTFHEPGAHGDLYRCRACGTVQQPSLPSGEELYELYRDMRDDAYLEEEQGRRRTARRLLDLIAKSVSRGRLLDVGCGHGLLLDEARKRGYDVKGLDLSRAAAAHAREAYGLEVAETTLHDPTLDGERYDVIVLADVIEHLDDPLRALDRCAELLAPGGALLLVTPDPASRTARLVGSRWWGYLPAHLCLFPLSTLRGLVADRGLEPVAQTNLVRTFSLRYWLSGLGARGPLLGRAVRAVMALAPRRASVSLSLGDERVILALRRRNGFST